MHKTSLLLFLLLITFYSCDKKTNKPSWDLSASIPLLKVEITAADLVQDSMFNENPDQSVSIVFEGDIFDFNFDSLVEFPSDLLAVDIFFPFVDPIEVAPGDPIFPTPFEFDNLMELDNNVKLDKIKILQGTVNFDMYNKTGGDILFDYSLEYAENEAGDAFEFSKLLIKEQWENLSFDMSGYTIGMNGLTGTGTNIIRSIISASLADTEPEPVSFSTEDTVNISIYFEDLVLAYAYGYFGEQTISLENQTVDLDLFNYNTGAFEVPQATVSLIAINDYGVDGRFNIQNMTAKNSITGETVSLEGAVLDSSYYFGKADEIGQLEHNIIRDTAHWDFSQSNILNLFGILPDELTFSATVESNITGDSIDRSNFFYADDKVSLGFMAAIDQGFQVGEMLSKDTISFEIDTLQLKNLDELSNPVMYIVAQNSFPFMLNVDLLLLEENYTLPEALVDAFTVEGPPIGEDLFSIDSVKSILEIELTKELIDKLKKTKHIIYQSQLSTVGETPVKIHIEDKLKLTVIIETDYRLETDDF